MTERELTDEVWRAIAPLVPQPRRRRGRPWRDHRQVLEGILWALRTGKPWREVPRRYGPWQTLYDRWSRWREDGTLAEILETLSEHIDRCAYPERARCGSGARSERGRCARQADSAVELESLATLELVVLSEAFSEIEQDEDDLREAS